MELRVLTRILLDDKPVQFCGRCMNKPFKMLLLETKNYRAKTHSHR